MADPHRRRWLWLLLALSAAGPGCLRGDPAEVVAVRRRVQAETARFAAEIDRLEARLAVDRARVETFALLARRHGRVSALACRNVLSQVRSMERVAARERRRSVRLARASPRPAPFTGPRDEASETGSERAR